jgi:hypothetical protein
MGGIEDHIGLIKVKAQRVEPFQIIQTGIRHHCDQVRLGYASQGMLLVFGKQIAKIVSDVRTQFRFVIVSFGYGAIFVREVLRCADAGVVFRIGNTDAEDFTDIIERV